MPIEERDRRFMVLVVDDHAIIRRGLRELIRENFVHATIEEASTLASLLPTVRRTRFDLVILDLQLQDGNALELIPAIVGCGPRVLAYSMNAEKLFAQQVMARGASGYLNKDSDEHELLRAMSRVLSGHDYLSPAMEKALRPTGRRWGLEPTDPMLELSDRERSVMTELLTGAGVKEIAARLDLQPTTVATYKARLFDKLGVSNVLDLQRLVHARAVQPTANNR